jgi:hypothetical protein
MFPGTLNDWTFDAVKNLCGVGQGESDRHDFKFNLPDTNTLTKLACAFANTFGGVIVVGVREAAANKFEIPGIEPDKELHGKFSSKVQADPAIDISTPKMICMPGSSKVLYAFHIPQSPRRPHLPSRADQRVFWKRQGSSCAQMTLEEIRYQMNTYEEKREKLTLLLIDLHHKLQSVDDQQVLADGQFNGDVFSFADLDAIKLSLMLLNAEKTRLLSMLSLSYDGGYKLSQISAYRDVVRKIAPRVAELKNRIEASLKRHFQITNPYAESA